MCMVDRSFYYRKSTDDNHDGSCALDFVKSTIVTTYKIIVTEEVLVFSHPSQRTVFSLVNFLIVL